MDANFETVAAFLAENSDVAPELVQEIVEGAIDQPYASPSAIGNTLTLLIVPSVTHPQVVREALLAAAPEVIARRVALSAQASSLTPLYTLDELRSITDLLMRYLEDNRDSLIKTGYPQTEFLKSRWLDWHFGRLYPVKRPVTEYANSPSWDKLTAGYPAVVAPDYSQGIQVEYSYVWAREPARRVSRS